SLQRGRAGSGPKGVSVETTMPDGFSCPECESEKIKHLVGKVVPTVRILTVDDLREQHPWTVRMMTDRLEQKLPIDAVEVGFYVEIEHPVVAPAALTSLAHGIDRRFAGPVAIGVGMKHRLQTRLQVATGDFLGNAVR